MSIKIMARVWAHSQRKDGELLVMLALADFANDAGESWPSLDVLAQKARLSKKQLCIVLKKLEVASEIQRKRSAGGRNRRTHYVINLLPENSDIKTVLKGNRYLENSVSERKKTVLPGLHALNHHRTVNRERETVRGKPSLSNGSGVKEFFDSWGKEYQERFSAPYVFTGGKEGAIIKRLLRSYDLPTLNSLALRFLDSKDPWVQQNGGFTIGVFYSQINKLVSTKATQTQFPVKELSICPPHTWKRPYGNFPRRQSPQGPAPEPGG